MKIICDICKMEIKYMDKIGAHGILIESGEYCKKCWTDKKNWEKIHKIKPSNEE